MFGRKSKKSADKEHGRAYPSQGGQQPGGYSNAGADDPSLPGLAGYDGGIKNLDHPNRRFRFVAPRDQ